MFTAAKVTLMVKDVEESVRFYRDLLGLKQTVRYGNEWVELEAPGTVLALHPKRKGAGTSSTEGMSIGFQVRDIDATVAMLKERKITVKHVEEGFLRRADFRDPDGYQLYLMQVRWRLEGPWEAAMAHGYSFASGR